MKRKTNYKNLISLALVLVLLIALTVPTSFALDTSKRRFGAMLLSALQALNITITSTLAPVQNALDYIADPPGYDAIYDYPWVPNWDDEILDRSVVQIWPDYTTIDGVEYTDIWFSNEAAEKFRVNAFDFKTALNIASESNGTFAQGVGSYANIPIYNINNQYRSQTIQYPDYGTYETGDYDVVVRNTGSVANPNYATYFTYNQSTSTFSKQSTTKPVNVYWYRLNNEWRIRNENSNVTKSADGTAPFVNSPFSFDWVSGTIPQDQILPSDTGLMIRVPSDTQGLETFIENNINFTNQGGVNLDFELHPELQIAVDDLLDILAPIVPIVNTGDIQFTVNHTEPAPAPIPDVPIIDATVPQVVQPIINEITNQGDIINQQIPQIIETIPTIDDICNNIDTAPYHDLDTGLDRLPSFFLPFISDLRSALGIWHYVTEWLSQVSTTFAFISGCLVGTSIMNPIYAAIAGFMCIKVYRRMTG